MPNVILPGTVQPASAGLTGFDVNQVLSAAQASAIKNAGYDFCIRYIPRPGNSPAGNLSNAEAVNILNAGLALMAVQHVSLPGWAPTAALGTANGTTAAQYASQTVGLPAGVNIWCDLEEVATGTTAANVIAYCQAWYAAVSAAGYVPGLYVGWNVVLNSSQLYNNLSFKHYWEAYNADLPVATRGYQLKQHTQVMVSGIEIDPNTTYTDNLGGTALWLSI